MKNIIKVGAIAILLLTTFSCKKEVSECNCGKITEYYLYHINGDEWNVPIPIHYTTKPKVVVKNNCSGNEKTFQLKERDDIKYQVGNDYCDNKSW